MGEKYLWSNTVAALYKLDNHNNFVMNCEFEIYFFHFNNLLYSVHTSRRCQSMVSDRLIAINTINNNQ